MRVHIVVFSTYFVCCFGQGLNPGCPPCDCGSSSIRISSQPQSIQFSSDTPSGFLPEEILTVKEGIRYFRVRHREPIKYIARETLKEIDRLIDDTADNASKFSVFMEAVAGHILDAVLPGSSKLIHGIKLILSMVRSTKTEIIEFKKQLDPEVQKDLLLSIEAMLAGYEAELPGCVRDSMLANTHHLSLHNFQYHEGVCPTKYDKRIIEDEELSLVNIQIQVPVDFSRLSTREILFRGILSVTFDNKYTMRMLPSFIPSFDTKGIQKLILLYGHTIGKEVSTYSLTEYFASDDIGVLTGDQFSLCIQQKLFTQMRLKDVKSYVSALIPYTPQTFSKNQINVKRLTCSGSLSKDSCSKSICNSASEFINLITRINQIQIPTDFDTGYKRSRRHTRIKLGKKKIYHQADDIMNNII